MGMRKDALAGASVARHPDELLSAQPLWLVRNDSSMRVPPSTIAKYNGCAQ